MKKKSINFYPKAMGHSHEIIDALYAFYQSQDPGFCSAIDFSMHKFIDPHATANVFLDYMPKQRAELFADFDLVLYSNGCEPLTVATEMIWKDVTELEHCYLICNSKVLDSHPYAEKIIWFPANIMVLRDLWTRYFFPHFHVNFQLQDQARRQKKIIFINGHGRSWRHHFATLLSKECPNIIQHSTISTTLSETNDSFFESDHDREFRHTVNEIYTDQIVTNSDSMYYLDIPMSGIDGKFGQWPPGYMLMPLYFEHSCVIFPESTWQNDELAITEKILKCFFAGAIPWPIGGSNLNHLYNDAGFQTAWNLLPAEHQAFDAERNHFRRYHAVIDAIKWLEKNPEVMYTEQARDMIALNRHRFLTCHSAVGALQKFHDLLQLYLH